MALLEVEGLSRSFGGVVAVRDVSFAVDAGEIVGVMGPNGSGKTTLFNLITGALTPDRGRIRLAGEPVTGLSPHRICAKGIARTFQLVHPFPGLTALENVLVGQLYGRKRLAFARARDEAERLLNTVGLGGKGHLPAAQLTVVERKRLELARALATAPRVLLMDEFMAGLTPAEVGEAIALLRGLHGQGITLVIVEHIVWALLDLSHRIVVLSAGEKIAEGTPAAVARDPTVVDVYLGTASRA
ncbi:MAG: ABC transporter ATP-binding protein [Candidatus Rokubacteria bacterium]|nr:ABC transporter ATP-binding protein [Candidatus Rokubacteria bacterium]